nr:diacylglycerol kinase [Sphingomonas deserti]
MDSIDPAFSACCKNRPFGERLGFASAGLRVVLRRERSFRVQSVIGVCAIGSVCMLQPGLIWTAMVAPCTGLVLALEAINAALEYAIDRLHPEFAEQIRDAKDAAAGAVLIASGTAFLVGTMMLASLAI